jgi:hypothetical protein
MTGVGWLILFSAAGLGEAGPAMEFTKAGIRCTESIDPPTVPLTGEARLTLTAEGPAPLTVDSVMVVDSPGWRVTAMPSTVADRPGSRQLWRQEFRLTPDRAGDLTVLPPPIRVRASGRETPVEIAWRPLTVRVTTTITRPDVDDARGVTGPEPAPPAEPFWTDMRFWAAVMVVIAVAAAVLAGRRVPPPPVPEPPPAEWAAGAVDRLAQGDPDAHRLAAVLREFLARQFHIAAAGSTTAELVARLPAVVPVADWQRLLERCDVARFSDRGFTELEWRQVLDQARRLVVESLPVAESAGSAGETSAGENA